MISKRQILVDESVEYCEEIIKCLESGGYIRDQEEYDQMIKDEDEYAYNDLGADTIVEHLRTVISNIQELAKE